MYVSTDCEGCKNEPLTTKHALECSSLIGSNELLTYIPNYKDLYREAEEEQVYIARLIRNKEGLLQHALQRVFYSIRLSPSSWVTEICPISGW